MYRYEIGLVTKNLIHPILLVYHLYFMLDRLQENAESLLSNQGDSSQMLRKGLWSAWLKSPCVSVSRSWTTQSNATIHCSSLVPLTFCLSLWFCQSCAPYLFFTQTNLELKISRIFKFFKKLFGCLNVLPRKLTNTIPGSKLNLRVFDLLDIRRKRNLLN